MNSLHTRRVSAALGAVTACLLAALGARAAGQAGGATSVLSATSFTFGAEPVGTPGPSQTLTVTNTGAATLNIVTIAVVGPDFSQTNTCGNSVAPGTNCAIDIVFDPIAFGTRNGSITISSNAANSPQSVTLVGTGMGPAVRISSAALTFPSQLVSTTSPQQTLVVGSTGDTPLTISTITVTGPFSENDTCVIAALDPGQVCFINVFFSPLAGGPAPGTLTLNDDAYPIIQTVALSGTGADFSMVLSPTTNSTSSGGSANYSVSVGSVGGFSGTVTLGCGGLSSGIGCSFSPSSVSVSGSTAATSMMTVSTTASSSRVPPGGGRRPRDPGFRLGPLWLGICLLSALTGLAVLRRRHRGLVLGTIAAAAVLLAALAMPGCGVSHSTAPKTTGAGTYYLIVTGTTPAGSLTIQNTATFSLVVN